VTDEEKANLIANVSDKEWRMNNLYYIVDKDVKTVLFKMNWVQDFIFKHYHKRNVCLKSRQHGVTTFWLIFFLDECLFGGKDYLSTGVISHRLADSKKFMQRIMFAYRKLPKWIVETGSVPTVETKNLDEVKFSNGCSISSTTSARSGTMHMLHVSEFGPMSYYYRDRAAEVMSGAVPAVPSNGILSFESTAKGTIGAFYELWKLAVPNGHCEEGEYPDIPRIAYRPFFFAWWQDPNNRLSEAETKMVQVKLSLEQYFTKLAREHGIKLDARQKAWYVLTEANPESDMRKEHPSTPEEAWQSSVEGLFYATQIAEAREMGRVCKLPFKPGFPVDTWWDFGVNDLNCIIFSQNIGRAVHVINFYKNSDRGLRHYANYLKEQSKPPREGGLGYSYGRHVIPHDGSQRQIGNDAKTIQEILEEYGVFTDLAPRSGLMEGIEQTRNKIGDCFFDTGPNVSDLLLSLESYRKQLDEKNTTDPDNPVFKDKPVHDIHSHPADAMRTLGVMHEFHQHHSLAGPVEIETWNEEIC
jgi:hypothetical protein